MGSVHHWSSLLLKTLRDDPADAEVASHKLLVRAGYVRRISAGVWAWLPIGWRVLRNVERVVREEMDAAGFQEIHLPALLPRDLYERTGRWVEYGDDLFRLTDRKGSEHLLGPTHEEVFTTIVGDLCSSYRDLPLVLYQIQTKFRDELRPRAGILRVREFLMKDSYSFDVDDDGLAAVYAAHRTAYIKAFDRLGLEHVIVAAHSGAMGGSASEEFLAPCEAGEDTFVRCPSCDLAANVEAVITPAPPTVDGDRPDRVVLDTPDTPTIETLVDLLNGRHDLRRSEGSWTASDTLKNLLVVLTSPDGSTTDLAIGLPGDREVDFKRLAAVVSPATVEPFGEDDFARHADLHKGYVGPEVLGESGSTGIRYVVDPRVVAGTAWVTGANGPGQHALLVAARDFGWDDVVDVAEVRAGDPCPRCGTGLQLDRGIEIGHIFQLGRKYTEALGVTVLDADGRAITPTMGSYGIGVSRAVAAVAEQRHDGLGLCWPASIAPFAVHLVPTGKTDEPFDVIERLAVDLADRGLDVLVDDRRDVSAGVKFKDAELMGMPLIAIAGRGLAGGVLELRDRRDGTQVDVPIAEVADWLMDHFDGSP